MFGSFWKRRRAITIAISPAAYDEIAEKLSPHLADSINDGAPIDMSGAVIVRGPEPAPEPIHGHRPLSDVSVKVRRR